MRTAEAASAQPRNSKLPRRGHREVFKEKGLDAGVRVTDDGRVNIKFRKHTPWLSNLTKHFDGTSDNLQEQPEPSEPLVAEFPLCLNVVIHVVGSRGDVQPFIALGLALQQHGHRIRLATHLQFRDDVTKAGLEFFNIGGDPSELMAFMVKNPGIVPDFKTIRSGAIQRRRREMRTILSGCWRSCFETGDGTNAMPDHARPFVADAIIANPPSLAHLSCAERLGIPLHMMFTMPWSPTTAFHHPLAMIQSDSTKPSSANFSSYAIIEMMMWEGLGDLINQFRKDELGTEPLDSTRAASIVHRLNVPYTYFWSPSLLPKPPDWSDNIDVCGFQFLPSQSDYEAPDELNAFLKAGTTPIYIGFGSIVVDDPAQLTKTLFEAVRLTGQRALISKGWGKLGGDVDVPDNIFLLGNCPHDWLFMHVSCVVHHGGAGTTAAGLRRGCPTVIVPFFGDQPFWGSIVARAGAGPPPVPFKQLTTDNLAAAINKALEPSTKHAASEIRDRMASETGTENAVQSFHRHLNLGRLNCVICPDRPAVWWVRKWNIKLSSFAAGILAQSGHIDSKDFALYRAQEYETDRDPNGPITAVAQVFYRVIVDVSRGVGGFVWNAAHLFSDSGSKQRRLREDEMHQHAVEHFAERLSNQQPQHNDGALRRRQAADRLNGGHAPFGAGVAQKNGSLRTSGRNSASHKRGAAKNSRAKSMVAETEYIASRFSKKTAKAIVSVPADLTLSLSKGFHNAPKYYHDTTVRKLPRVDGVQSGLQAAGKEFKRGFDDGISGVLLLPAHGYQRSGGRGLVTGIGKGLAGVFFKPIAGIIGLAGYPLNGLHKALRKSLTAKETKDILLSRITLGTEELRAASAEERAMVIRAWEELTSVPQHSL